MVLFLVVIVICFAYFIQAAFAFGGPLIAAPILSLIVGPKDAVVLTTIFSLLGSVLIVKLWRDVDWQKICWLVPNLILGLVVGLAVFSFLNERVLLLLLAAYLVLHVLNDQLKPNFMGQLTASIPQRLRAVAGGFTGGFIQGATGIGGGPPIAAYLQTSCRTIDAYRGTYMLTWLAGNLFRLAFMGLTDVMHGRIVQRSLVTLPFFMVSIFAGYYLPNGISKRTFNTVISLLLLVTAVSIVAKCAL
jgi:uncharacterized protein